MNDETPTAVALRLACEAFLYTMEHRALPFSAEEIGLLDKVVKAATADERARLAPWLRHTSDCRTNPVPGMRTLDCNCGLDLALGDHDE